MSFAFALLAAAIAGAAMALQGTFNTAAGKVIGIAENTLLVHVVGLFVIALLLFVFRIGRGDWGKIAEIPWHGYLGGVLSAVIIFAVIYSMGKLGVGNATVIIVLVQVGRPSVSTALACSALKSLIFPWLRLLGLF